MVRKLKPGEHPHLNWGMSVTSIAEIPVRDIRSVVAGGTVAWDGGSYPIREAWECGGRDTPSRFALLETGRRRAWRVLAVQMSPRPGVM